MADSGEEHFVTPVIEDHQTTCWGCGLRLLLPTYAPVFKCGWCGAITNQNVNKPETKCLRWRRLRDRCFVCTLFMFMLFVICGGVWAVYPVVFSVSYTCGVLHSILTMTLAATTISTFSLAAFQCAGTPPIILWGSYPVVGKGGLENYTFCHYCSKPKSPRAHHCRSCGTCILDMDHHCPFIGNCVGAANHRHFIAFLFSAVVSTIYVSVMSAYAGLHIWPPLKYRSPGHLNSFSSGLALRALKEVVLALLSSAVQLSARGLVLVYLFVSSVSVQIGLSVLLWQQLCYIYEGKTYLSHLSSRGSDPVEEKDCQNIFRFFGWPYSILRYLPSERNSRKRHKKCMPTLVINNRQYRGKLDRAAVLKAICAGFQETTEPAICLSEDIETNECLENNGGCWWDKNANITACRDTFRGRVCECPIVNGVKFSGDGYTHCEASGALHCEINNGGCWTKTQDGRTYSACVDDHSHGCKCPPGFKGDGVNSCKDVDECKEKLACQCRECKCKNTWGSYECSCSGGTLYMREHDTCIGKEASTKVSWGYVWAIIFGLVAAGAAGYAFYKYRIRRYMDSEIRAIMAQYMPLDNQPNNVHHPDI